MNKMPEQIDLKERNQEAYDKMCILLSKYKKACVIQPMETGRNLIGFKYVAENPLKTVMWLSPSKYDFLAQYNGLRMILTSDSYNNIIQRINHHTYSFIMKMCKETNLMKADIIILEDFHRCGAPKWGEAVKWLLEINNDAVIIGLSSTDIRYLDNHRNMAKELFDNNIASYMTLSEALADSEHITPLYVVAMDAHENQQLKELSDKTKHIIDGNRARYARKMLGRIKETLRTSESIGSVFAKYMLKSGRYIVFCENSKQFDVINERKSVWFAGIDDNPHIYTISCKDSSFINLKNIDSFVNDRSEHLKLLLNVNMINRRYRAGNVDGVIMLRRTESPTVYFNQISLALLSLNGQGTVIFDIVNNFSLLITYGAGGIEPVESAKGEKGAFKKIKGLEVIDKTVNSRRLFAELQNNLNKDWSAYYLEAKAYYEENDDLRIKVSYISPSGLSLGRWLKAQKQIKAGLIKGSLSTEQQRLLDLIGIDWEEGIDKSQGSAKKTTNKGVVCIKEVKREPVHNDKWYVIRTRVNWTSFVEKNLADWIPETLYRDAFYPLKESVKIDEDGEYQVSFPELFGPYIFIKTDVPGRIHNCICWREDYKGFVKTANNQYFCMDDYDKEMFDFILKNKPIVDYSVGIVTKRKRTILSGPLLGMEKRICAISRSRKTVTLRYDCPLLRNKRIDLPLRFVKYPEQADDDFPTLKKIEEETRRIRENELLSGDRAV